MVCPACRFPSFRLQFIIAGLVLSLIGCVNTEPLALHLPYGSVTTSRVDQTEKNRSCRIVIAAVRDERPNRETLGYFGTRPLVAEHVTEWIQSRLGTLSRDGYTLQSAPGDFMPTTSYLTGEVGVRRIYARTLTMTFEAVVTIAGRFRGGEDGMTERQYRGSSTKVNWMGGNWEIIGILNEALDDALSQMGEDLKMLCGREGLEMPQ
jgi:hypothetical protein